MPVAGSSAAGGVVRERIKLAFGRASSWTTEMGDQPHAAVTATQLLDGSPLLTARRHPKRKRPASCPLGAIRRNRKWPSDEIFLNVSPPSCLLDRLAIRPRPDHVAVFGAILPSLCPSDLPRRFTIPLPIAAHPRTTPPFLVGAQGVGSPAQHSAERIAHADPASDPRRSVTQCRAPDQPNDVAQCNRRALSPSTRPPK